MKKILLLLAIGVLLGTSLFAKRMPPTQVDPVQNKAIEYRVSEQIGSVEAWDIESDSIIWIKQIYVVKYVPKLEKDIQDVFISTLEVVNNTLLIKNENRSVYRLSLRNLTVKLVKGKFIEEIPC